MTIHVGGIRRGGGIIAAITEFATVYGLRVPIRICYRIAAVRREVKRLNAVAEKRAAETENVGGSDRFRP